MLCTYFNRMIFEIDKSFQQSTPTAIKSSHIFAFRFTLLDIKIVFGFVLILVA